VSFNALHWVPEQQQALSQISTVARPEARVLIQVVCAGARASLESVAMTLARSRTWARWFEGFNAPFVHVVPADYEELAHAAGLKLLQLTVADREWDFGSTDSFGRWCAVGSGAWTDRLDPADRSRFVDDLVQAYEQVSGRPGLFRFTQMRAELSK
jgi:trans-aconitate 2-methyltransferase